MFSKEAREEGLDELWFKCTRRELMKSKKEGESISFPLYRLFQFIEAYHWFINHEDIKSMIFFQNRNGDPIQTNVLSCLIDGTYKYQNTPFEDELPSDWSNDHIRISKDWEEVEGSILKELSESKDSKIMLVSAYASFKAGANMQYEIPDSLDFVKGDNWETNGVRLKKDWDAVYVQCPSAYLMMSEDGNEFTFEKSLYNAMLSLMMLYERGCLSKNEVASWLCRALSNNANYVKRQLDRMRSIALRYTPHPVREDDFEDDVEEGTSVPHNVQINQLMNQSYKQTIIKKPVIDDYNELVEEDKQLTFICKCYGDWQRNENNEYFFSFDPNRRNDICPQGKGKLYPQPISPSTVRLDVLIKNDVIRKHFITNGYATDWKSGNLILHPEILKTDYAGEIGEEAFKAIVLEYTNCKEEDFKHLEGRDYELADFVICNPDGTYKIAFDVKNMNPLVEHNDKQGELATKDKRKIKRERLGCQLITVSMLQLTGESMDAVTEIHGIIDNDGNIIPSAIDRLKRIIG